MAGFYYNTDPNATGNQVLNNKIHDVSDASALDADGYAGQGIYLDENTSSALVENNLVYRTSPLSGADLRTANRGRANTIKNNILPTDVGHQAGRLRSTGCGSPAIYFHNNLIYFDMGYVQTGYAYCMADRAQKCRSTPTTCTATRRAWPVRCLPTRSTPPVRGPVAVYVLRGLSAWQSGTGEILKRGADPGFANPVYPDDDYSLAESPA